MPSNYFYLLKQCSKSCVNRILNLIIQRLYNSDQ